MVEAEGYGRRRVGDEGKIGREGEGREGKGLVGQGRADVPHGYADVRHGSVAAQAHVSATTTEKREREREREERGGERGREGRRKGATSALSKTQVSFTSTLGLFYLYTRSLLNYTRSLLPLY
jgi:hypothetical protein